MKQIQVVARAGLKPGTAGLQVRCTDHLAMLPPQPNFSVTVRKVDVLTAVLLQ